MRLVRHEDFLQWFFCTFKRSFFFINNPKKVSNLDEMKQCFENLKNQTFRGYTIISVDMENVNIGKTCYNDYPKSQQQFVDPKYPTHRDYPLSYVRQISIGSIYGDTYIINAAKMTEPMVNILLDFLHACTTIVVGFNWKNDAWAFHLTFGERKRSYRDYESAPRSSRAQFRADNVLKLLRVFDVENALRSAAIVTKQHQIQKYIDLAMVPEGGRLWDFAQTAVGFDLINHDLPPYSNRETFWNVDELSTQQLRYAALDAQTPGLCFLVMLRYHLFPEAEQLIGGFPHDYRDVSSLRAQIDQYPTENQEKHLFQEVQLLIDCRNGFIEINPSNSGFCTASALDPGKLSKIAKSEYISGTFPVVPSSTQKSEKSHDDSESDAKLDQPSTRPKNVMNEDYNPESSFDLTTSPGDWPMFLIANSPRSRVEAEVYLMKVMNLYQRILNQPKTDENAKKLKNLRDLHWLNSEGKPIDALRTLVKDFPKESPAKDCWNNFATSYVNFDERAILPTEQSKTPDVSLTTNPKYAKNPHFYISLHLMKTYAEEDQTPDPVDNALTESLSNLKVQEKEVEMIQKPVSDEKPIEKPTSPPTPVPIATKKPDVATASATKKPDETTSSATKKPTVTKRQKPTPLLPTPTAPHMNRPTYLQLLKENDQLKLQLFQTNASLDLFKKLYNDLLIQTATSNMYIPSVGSWADVSVSKPMSSKGREPPMKSVVPRPDLAVVQSLSETSEEMESRVLLVPVGINKPAYKLDIKNADLNGNMTSNQLAQLKLDFYQFAIENGIMEKLTNPRRSLLGKLALEWQEKFDKSGAIEMAKAFIRWAIIVQYEVPVPSKNLIQHACRGADDVIKAIIGFMESPNHKLPKSEQRHEKKINKRKAQDEAENDDNKKQRGQDEME